MTRRPGVTAAIVALAMAASGCGPTATDSPDAAVDAGRDGALDAAPITDAEPIDVVMIDAELGDSPIQDLQDPSRAGFRPAGSRVRVDGVVVTARDVDSNVLFVQEPTGDALFSGIFVLADPLPAGSALPNVGDLIDVRGTVREFSRSGFTGSRTNIETVTSLVVRGTAAVPAALLVDEQEIAVGGARAEQLEGVLVKVATLTVTAVEPGFGQFSILYGVIVSGRLFGTAAPLALPYLRDSYSEATGVLDFDFGAPRLLPRQASDLVGYLRAPPCMRAVMPATTNVGENQIVTLTAEIDRPAPAGGTTLTLDTTNATVATPTAATAAVAAGATTASVPVRGVVASASPVTIGASIDSCAVGSEMKKTSLVTVLLGPNPKLLQVVPAAISVMAGGVAGSEGVLTVVVDRPAPVGGTTVTLGAGTGVTAPVNVVVPEGATRASFKVRGTGAASATAVTVLATLGSDTRSATVSLTSTASLPAMNDLVINEILAAPLATLPNGDANCDGVASTTQDEFVELASLATAPLNLGLVELNDSAGTPNGFRFPAGYTLGPGEVVVIFSGGGAVTQSHPWCAGSFGGVRVERANLQGALGLNNGGDTLTMRTSTGTVITVSSYGSVSAGPSITRDPDLTGATFVPHTSAVGRALDRNHTPGTRLTAAPFWLARP